MIPISGTAVGPLRFLLAVVPSGLELHDDVRVGRLSPFPSLARLLRLGHLLRGVDALSVHGRRAVRWPPDAGRLPRLHLGVSRPARLGPRWVRVHRRRAPPSYAAIPVVIFVVDLARLQY